MYRRRGKCTEIMRAFAGSMESHSPSPYKAADAAGAWGAALARGASHAAGQGASLDGAPQRVVKVRRDYNSWVARETMEDYALRFTPRSFRKWSELRVANTAFGAASFLVLEAVGATLLVQYGFLNAFWAIVATGLIIFLAGLPISVYAARHGLDMDLLTRGAGFGYIGSTFTSLIYASFTFIFFALEAAIMAYALELAFDIPPAWGYLICALVVIPLVTHGVTAISKLQVWTQPLWLVMLVVPFVYVFRENPGLLRDLAHYGGQNGQGAQFDVKLFGAAMTVGIALITQMGEQVDYLRFMPERIDNDAPATALGEHVRWWAGVLIGGPGWVVLGVVKMLGGALLAYLAISLSVPADRAVDPNQMYLAAYEYVFPHYGWAVAATAIFVVISQLKINVTNAYAGSLAWSNFFARLTHSHPGRVVWVVFNTLIALMLMELNVFQALGSVLGLYSNIAIAWMMAVVADLVINKPLGLSPPGIEFKRAHLYDINPVGVGAMGAASVLSIAAYLGLLGPSAQAFSALIALVTAFVAAPLIAWVTKGKYYLARADPPRAGRGGEAGVSSRCGARRASRHAGRHPCSAGRQPEGEGALHDLRARVRGRRPRALPRVPRKYLLAVLHARRALRRPVQAEGSAFVESVGSSAARAAAALDVALPRNRPRPLPAADGDRRAAARRPVRSALPPRAEAARRAGRSVARAGAQAVVHQGLRRAAADRRDRRLVARAHAQEPAGRAGGEQPPDASAARADAGAAARDRVAPAHRRATAGSQAHRGPREPGEDALHLGDQPRAAHAAQQHPRLCATARRGRRVAAAPQAGGAASSCAAATTCCR